MDWGFSCPAEHIPLPGVVTRLRPTEETCVTPRIAAQRLRSTIASSEQEAARTLGSVLESDSRCLLSLTQAFASCVA